MAKKKKRKVKFKTRLKKWWKKHWDEVVLIGSVSIGIVLMLFGIGVL